MLRGQDAQLPLILDVATVTKAMIQRASQQMQEVTALSAKPWLPQAQLLVNAEETNSSCDCLDRIQMD